MFDKTFVRVYRLPPPNELQKGYCFGGDVPITVYNVDWFRITPFPGGTDALPTRDQITEFIKKKGYYNPRYRYLVLGDDPANVFTIEQPEDKAWEPPFKPGDRIRRTRSGEIGDVVSMVPGDSVGVVFYRPDGSTYGANFDRVWFMNYPNALEAAPDALKPSEQRENNQEQKD